jgi:hypothetical protein
VPEYFARHGGVHFETRAEPERINRFVRELPENKRDNLFEVLQELDRAGLIRLKNDHQWVDGHGKREGGESR